MVRTLRRQRMMVMLGLLTVAGGWIGYLALVSGERSYWQGQDHANIIFGIGSVLGYAVFAVASWSWFKWMESAPVQLAGIARVLRLFAIGFLFLAVGLAAIGYFWADQAITQPYGSRIPIVAAVTYGLEFLGFLLAAVAFWDASAEASVVGPDLSAPEGELVTS